jgi:hypothetical protein
MVLFHDLLRDFRYLVMNLIYNWDAVHILGQ